MKKMLIILTTMLLINGTFCGCSKDNPTDTTDEISTVGDSQASPQIMVDANPSEDDAKWDSVINKVYELGLDSTTYPCSQELYIMARENQKLIDFTVVIKDGTSDEDGLAYTVDLVKLFNDTAKDLLDNSIVESSQDYYGSLFDEYNINLTVSTEENAMYESKWLVCQSIPAGTNEAVKKGGYVAK